MAVSLVYMLDYGLIIMGFSLLSGTEFFVVPKNGVLRNN